MAVVEPSKTKGGAVVMVNPLEPVTTPTPTQRQQSSGRVRHCHHGKEFAKAATDGFELQYYKEMSSRLQQLVAPLLLQLQSTEKDELHAMEGEMFASKLVDKISKALHLMISDFDKMVRPLVLVASSAAKTGSNPSLQQQQDANLSLAALSQIDMNQAMTNRVRALLERAELADVLVTLSSTLIRYLVVGQQRQQQSSTSGDSTNHLDLSRWIATTILRHESVHNIDRLVDKVLQCLYEEDDWILAAAEITKTGRRKGVARVLSLRQSLQEALETLEGHFERKLQNLSPPLPFESPPGWEVVYRATQIHWSSLACAAALSSILWKNSSLAPLQVQYYRLEKSAREAQEFCARLSLVHMYPSSDLLLELNDVLKTLQETCDNLRQSTGRWLLHVVVAVPKDHHHGAAETRTARPVRDYARELDQGLARAAAILEAYHVPRRRHSRQLKQQSGQRKTMEAAEIHSTASSHHHRHAAVDGEPEAPRTTSENEDHQVLQSCHHPLSPQAYSDSETCWRRLTRYVTSSSLSLSNYEDATAVPIHVQRCQQVYQQLAGANVQLARKESDPYAPISALLPDIQEEADYGEIHPILSYGSSSQLSISDNEPRGEQARRSHGGDGDHDGDEADDDWMNRKPQGDFYVRAPCLSAVTDVTAEDSLSTSSPTRAATARRVKSPVSPSSLKAVPPTSLKTPASPRLVNSKMCLTVSEPTLTAVALESNNPSSHTRVRYPSTAKTDNASYAKDQLQIEERTQSRAQIAAAVYEGGPSRLDLASTTTPGVLTNTEERQKQEREDFELALRLQSQWQQQNQNQSLTGRSCMLALRIQELCSRWRRENCRFRVHSVDFDTVVSMAERIIMARNEFQRTRRPTNIDVGYHYTTSERLHLLQEGSMVEGEDDLHGNQHLEPDEAYGMISGVHTATYPHRYQGSIREVVVLVARLRGREVELERAHDPGVDSVVGLRDTHDEIVVLRGPDQCLPLVHFPTSGDRHLPVRRYQFELQEVIDQLVNTSAIATVITTGAETPNTRPQNGEGRQQQNPVNPMPNMNTPRAETTPTMNTVAGRRPSVGSIPTTVHITTAAPVARVPRPNLSLTRMTVVDRVAYTAPKILRPVNEAKIVREILPRKTPRQNCPICQWDLQELPFQHGMSLVPQILRNRPTAVQIMACRHVLHRSCLQSALQHSHHKCPICRVSILTPRGGMPSGKMEVSRAPHLQCGGYRQGTIVIDYSLFEGKQKSFHPNPGADLVRTHYRAYLPNNIDGCNLLKRLKFAFKCGLTFKVNRRGFAEPRIPHKTSLQASEDGFPDANYFSDANQRLNGLWVPPVEQLAHPFYDNYVNSLQEEAIQDSPAQL